jgi:hypothetical protein
MIVTLILAVLTGLLLVAAVLQQLSSVDLSHTVENSNIASQIYDYRLIWIGLVPLVIAVAAFFHPKEKHH